jgi:hypothetical protein
MAITRESPLPIEWSWSLLVGALLGVGFILAIVLLLVNWTRDPHRYLEERYGPLRESPTEPDPVPLIPRPPR